MNEKCLLFLHLPRTGGSTLTTLLRWQYRNLQPAEIRRFSTEEQSFDEIGKVSLEQKARLKVVMGHFPYGIHECIPKACRYITIVREPVQRVVSVYRYILSAPSHPMYEALTPSSMSLDEYVRSGIHRSQSENALTRQLAGRNEEGELTVRDLEIAKRNLRGFLAVGLTDAFDESVILFKRLLGWSTPFYFNRNVSSRGPRPEQPLDKTLELIRERNGFDLEIYELARSLLGSLIQQHGEGFERELSVFKFLNRGPRALGRLVEPIAPEIRRRLERRATRRSSPI